MSPTGAVESEERKKDSDREKPSLGVLGVTLPFFPWVKTPSVRKDRLSRPFRAPGERAPIPNTIYDLFSIVAKKKKVWC